MSIQSNINQGINQATLLAQLSPGIQTAAETGRQKRELGKLEKQLTTMRGRDQGEALGLQDPEKGYNQAATAVLPDEAEVSYYNKVLARQEELKNTLASKGYRKGQQFGNAKSLEDVFKEQQKAKEQRARVEATQRQKAAEAEAIKAARSKQIRDLIMNPNLEVK